jgi:SRSO17 transposase
VSPEELDAVRARLEDFAGEVFEPFARREQRVNGGLYLRGLMLDGRRKSMVPMAERLGVDHQRLQQFITSSTWDHAAVRRRLADRALDVVNADAWVVDDTGHVKDGPASPCVSRQYTGTAGKVTNCQIAVSVHAVTDTCSAPLDWRLFMPESWDDTRVPDAATAAAIRARRTRCGIADDQRHRRKWELALDMLDAHMFRGHTPPVLVADAGYGDATEFRLGLAEREIPYVVAVKHTTTAYPATARPAQAAYSGQGRPPRPRYPSEPTSVRELVIAAGRTRLRRVTWRHGSKKTPSNPGARMRSRFLVMRVRPANRLIPHEADGSLAECWLLAEWPSGEPEPTDFWLSTLPVDTLFTTLVRLAKIRWRIEHDYRELKTGLGLTHFEGRSWTGWHRHVTLVTAAHLFLTELRLADPKAVGAA